MKIVNPRSLILCIVCTLLFVSFSLGLDFKIDLLSQKDKKTPAASVSEANVVYCFFRDNYFLHDFPYIYPEKTSKIQIDDKVFKNGEASLRFDLDPDAFSGGAICIWNRTIDLRPYVKKGAVQFWIKGAMGNELAWISLVDDNTDMKKTVVRLPADPYVDPNKQITKEWSFVNIPLKEFNSVSVAPCYWDSIKQREVPHEFDWDRVAEFRLESKQNENKSFRVWADDVFIVKKQKKNPLSEK